MTRSGFRAARLVLAGLACSLLAAARAAEPESDSISAAKQQLDLMKSDATSAKAGATTGAVPRVALPEVNTSRPDDVPAPSGDALTREAKRRQRQERAAANWLVDAMMKDEKKGDPKRETSSDPLGAARGDRSRVGMGESLDSDLDVKDDDSLVAVDRQLAAEATGKERNERAPQTPNVANPLARYMADWLSPQDYQVLQKTVDVPREGASAMRDVTLPGAPSTDASLGSALAGLSAFAGEDRRSAFTPPPTTANPFLQNLSTPDPASFVSPAPVAPIQNYTPAPTPAIPAPPFQETAPAKTGVPEFVRPTTDDKYFKPLKKF